MCDDEQAGFLAGDEYQRAAGRDTDERVEVGESRLDGPDEQEPPVDLPVDLPMELVSGRFEDDDPPGCPAPRHPVG